MIKAEIPLILGVLIYALIALWQAAKNVSVIIQAGGFVVILAVLACLLKAKSDEKLKKVEMTAVWCCIGLFVLYGVLVLTGVL